MPESISAEIAEINQKFSTGQIVELYKLDATAIGGPIYYFTSSANGGSAISFGGNTYVPVPFEAEGFEYTGKGAFPQPKIRISNANKVLHAAAIEYADLIGSTITRIRTYKQFLDGEASADSTVTFPLDVYKVERKSVHNKVFMEWELSASIDQEGVKIPKRQILKDACTHRYRIYDATQSDNFNYDNATCPYDGTLYFNRQGVEIFIPDSDSCGKRLSDCRKRFGQNAELPFRGFPGVGRVN